MKRFLAIALCALLSLIAVGSPGIAATNGVGTGVGDVSILSVTQNLSGADQTVNIGTASGFATNDPPRNSLSNNKATVLLKLARAIGVSVPDLSAYDVTANVECDAACQSSGKSASSSGASETKTLPSPSQVATGQVVVGAKNAEAGRDHALASLSQVSIDANVFDGLVAVSGASIDFSKLSNTSASSSSSTIGIDRLDVLPFGKILDLSTLSLDDLVSLANAIDPTGALAGPVDTAKTSLYDTINSELATLNSPPLSLGITISSDMSMADLISVAQTISSNPLVATTLPAFKTALDAAIAALQSALDTLESTIAGISLLTLEGLSAGSKAEAFPDHAVASASVLDLGTVKVAGQTVAKPGDLTTYLNTIRSTVETLEAALKTVPVFSSLEIDIGLWDTGGTGTSFSDPYHIGVGKLATLSVHLSYNPTFDVKVLSFNTRAEYKGVAPTATGGPGGPGLATTGTEDLWIITGMLLIGLSIKLATSLRRLPQES